MSKMGSFWVARVIQCIYITSIHALHTSHIVSLFFPTSRARFSLGEVLFGKYMGALPCLSTVAQLPDCLRTQSCHHRHVSIPVLP